MVDMGDDTEIANQMAAGRWHVDGSVASAGGRGRSPVRVIVLNGARTARIVSVGATEIAWIVFR